jgi:hypothetical protein
LDFIDAKCAGRELFEEHERSMSGLPNGNTLKTLPLRALVAFAARCAQRVNPYFYLPPEHPEAQVSEEAVRQAARISLDFVNGSLLDPRVAHSAEDGVVRALLAASEGECPDTKAALSCNAAYAAINATVLALDSVKAPSRATEGSKVVAAAVTALEASLVVDIDIRHKVIRDFQILNRLSLGRFPEWGRGFDASEKGTLGPLELTRDAQNALKSRMPTVSLLPV